MSNKKIPKHVQELLSQLDFFSRQTRDVKPCIKRKIFVDSASWTGAAYRMFYGESKEYMISYLKTIMEDYPTICAENLVFKPLLDNNLRRFRNGILKLFETYKQHSDVIIELNIVMMMIDLNLGVSPEHINVQWNDTNKCTEESLDHAEIN